MEQTRLPLAGGPERPGPPGPPTRVGAPTSIGPARTVSWGGSDHLDRAALLEAWHPDEEATDPALYPALLQLAREAGLTVALGVYEDDDEVVDVAGTPLAVHDGAVTLQCADCDDLHHLGFGEIAWVELLDPGPGEGADTDWSGRRRAGGGGGVAPTSRTNGSGQARRRGR